MADEKKVLEETVKNATVSWDDDGISIAKCFQELWFNRQWTSLSSCWGGNFRIDTSSMFELAKKDGDIFSAMDFLMDLIGTKGIALFEKGWKEQLDRAKYVEEYEEAERVFSDKYGTIDLWKEDLWCELLFAWQVYFEAVCGLSKDERRVKWDIKRFKIVSAKNTFKQVERDEIIGFNHYDYSSDTDSTLWADDLEWFLYKRDPDNKWEGISMFNGIAMDMLNDLEAAKTNLAYYTNGWNPNVIYIVDENRKVHPDELENTKREIKKNYWGSSKSGKFLLSNFIKDVKTISWSPADMQNLEGRKFNKTKKLAALRVNEEFLWYNSEVGSESKMRQHWKMLFVTNVETKTRRMNRTSNSLIQNNKECFTSRLPELEMRWISASYDEFVDKSEQLREDFKLWKYSINQWRGLCWEEEVDAEWANKHYVDKNRVVLGDGLGEEPAA